MKRFFPILEKCSKAQTYDDYKKIIDQFNNYVPFTYMNSGFTDISDYSSNGDQAQFVNISYPQSWLTEYINNNFIYKDPVTIATIIRPSLTARTWQEIYRLYDYIDKDFSDIAKDFGMNDGITHALIDNNTGYCSLFTFNIRDCKPTDRDKDLLTQITPFLHQAILNIYKPPIYNKVELPPEKIEILNHLKENRTAWQISKRIHQSEKTTIKTINQIQTTLNTQTPTQTLATALNQKLIEL